MCLAAARRHHVRSGRDGIEQIRHCLPEERTGRAQARLDPPDLRLDEFALCQRYSITSPLPVQGQPHEFRDRTARES